MTDENQAQEPEVVEAPEPVAEPKNAKQKMIKNTTARPITLIVDKDTRETFMPGKTQSVDAKFLREIKKNSGAMTFFDSGELQEV